MRSLDITLIYLRQRGFSIYFHIKAYAIAKLGKEPCVKESFLEFRILTLTVTGPGRYRQGDRDAWIFLQKRFAMKKREGLMFLFALAVSSVPINALAQDARTLVREAFDYFRGETSFSTVEMTIHRADWERRMTMKGWTKGLDKSLIIITEPPKDEGNGTLKKGQEMWTYNPKVNRVIKIPPSMMAQSWMGSDFSNNDLAKSDTLIHDYDHSLLGSTTMDGKKVYLIESRPKPQAPVVWGMQKLKVREDFIFLEQVFYDEYLKPVKILSSHDIQMLGGKLFPKIMKVRKADEKEEYTMLEYRELTFGVHIQDSLFTLSSLRTRKR